MGKTRLKDVTCNDCICRCDGWDYALDNALSKGVSYSGNLEISRTCRRGLK